MKRQQSGGALITTLILLTAIAIMLSTIIYVTRQFSKHSDAIQDGGMLRQAAYISMLENEAILIRQSQKDRFQNISKSSQLSIPLDNTQWIVKDYPEETINYYAYARNFIDYIPSEVSMFSANGSYVYSLFAKVAHERKEQGFTYHENFWINSVNVYSQTDDKLVLSLPNIKPNHLSEADYGLYLSALDTYTQSITASIDRKELTISSNILKVTYNLSSLCDSDDSCKLAGGWVINPNKFKWVIAVYSEKGVYIWIAGEAGEEAPTENESIPETTDFLTVSGVSNVSCSAVNNGYCACTQSNRDRLQRCMELIGTNDQNDSRVAQCQAQYGGNNPNQAGYQCSDVCGNGLKSSCVNLQPTQNKTTESDDNESSDGSTDMTPTIKLNLSDEAEIKSNLVFIRMQGETYFAYVEKDKKGNDNNDDSGSNDYLISSGVSSVACSAVSNGYCACTKSKKDRLQRCMELIGTDDQNDSRVSQCQAQYGGNNPNQAGYQCKNVCKPGLNAACVNLQPSSGADDSSDNSNGGKTELVLRDLDSGEIVNKTNASVSSVGKDNFMLSVIDRNTNLVAEQMLIFGDKSKFGVAEVSEHSLNNMNKKYSTNTDELVQPLIVVPVGQLNQDYWVFAVMQNQLQAFYSEGSDFENISDDWSLSSLSDIHYALPYGGLLFVQYGNNNLAVVTMNKGIILKTYTGISPAFSLKADMQSMLMYLVSDGKQVDISAIALLFMRENLKQVNND